MTENDSNNNSLLNAFGLFSAAHELIGELVDTYGLANASTYTKIFSNVGRAIGAVEAYDAYSSAPEGSKFSSAMSVFSSNLLSGASGEVIGAALAGGSNGRYAGVFGVVAGAGVGIVLKVTDTDPVSLFGDVTSTVGLAPVVNFVGNGVQTAIDLGTGEIRQTQNGVEISRLVTNVETGQLDLIEVNRNGKTLSLNMQNGDFTVSDSSGSYQANLADQTVNQDVQDIVDSLMNDLNAELQPTDPNFTLEDHIPTVVEASGYNVITVGTQQTYTKNGFNFTKDLTTGNFHFNQGGVNAHYDNLGKQYLTYENPNNGEITLLTIASDGTKTIAYTGSKETITFNEYSDLPNEFKGALQRFGMGVNGVLEDAARDLFDAFPDLDPNDMPSVLAALLGDTSLEAVPPIPGFKPNFDDYEDLYGPEYQAHEGDVSQALADKGFNVDGLDSEVVVRPDGTLVSFVSKLATVAVDGISYIATEIAAAVEKSATALANFVGEQVEDAASWFTASDGLQLDVANWMATNLTDLVNGNIDADEAFIDFAKYVALSRFSEVLSETLTFDGAKNYLSEVLDGFGLGPTEAAVFTSSIAETFQRLAVEFVASGFELEGDAAKNVAVGAVASVVTSTYVKQILGIKNLDSATIGQSAKLSGAVAAVTTLAVGLANSSDYTQSDWVLLGVNTGVAYGAGATYGTVSSLSIFGEAGALAGFGGPAAIAAAAIIGIFGGKIISSIYSGKSFGVGEFPSMEAALSSIYQVQQIDDGTGNMVDALLAVNPEGSVIIAQGITHIIGGAGHDTLVGNELDNVIDGQAGDDYIEGRDGVDGLFGGEGGDHIAGNAGDDIIDGGNGDDELFGGAGDDTILGGAGYDFIMGADGNDTIVAGDDRDIVLAGVGDDVVDAGVGNDFVDGGSGDDVLVGGDGDDILLGNAGNDTLAGDAGNDVLFGEDGNDTLNGGQGNDFIDGGNGTNILSGESGQDMLIGGMENDFLDGGLGNDRLNGGSGDDVLEGGLDNDLLFGDIGDDTLSGGDGDDDLIAGFGTDSLDGGAGNDRYLFALTDGTNTITDSAGNDRVVLSGIAIADVTFTEDGNDLLINYGTGTDSVRIVDQLTSPIIETLEVSDGQVDLTAMTFTSGVANYTLDTVVGTATDDMETALVSFIEDSAAQVEKVTQNQVLQILGETAYIETIRENADNTIYNGTEIVSYSKYRGSFFGHKFGKYTAYKVIKDTELDGQTDVVKLTVLEPGDSTAGYDNVFTNAEISTSKYYYGYSANGLRNRTTVTDIFVDGEAISTVVEYAVRVSFNSPVEVYKVETVSPDTKIQLYDDNVLNVYAAMDAYDRRAYSNIDNITVGENQIQTSMDQIIGTSIGETINGGYGDDLLYGGGGADTINGGSGNDWIFGNTDGDTLDGGQDQDFIHGGALNDIINGGSGDDGILGAGGDDTIDGGAGDDWIDAGDGDDTIIASEGNDVIDGGAGNDTINYSSITTSLDIDLNSNTVINAAFIHYINGVENIIAGAASDEIVGNNEDNILKGSLGDDTIYGNGGNDELTGDEGADTLYGGDGNDILKGRHDDDILYGGDGDDILFGHNDDDQLYGEDGNDILNGGNGHDYINGGAGNDTLSFNGFTSAVVANLSTNYYYSSGFGVHNYTVLNIENLEGSDYSDTLTGDAQDNKIVATIGNDTINGGAGIDTIDYSNITTAINVDLISSKYDIDYNGVNDHSLSNIENFIGSQYSDRIRGDALANIIHGQNGDDVLIGNLGNDILYGEGGNDQLTGDEGADTLYGGDGDDILKGRHDNDILYGGDGDDTLYGQNDDDQLYGEDGDDILNGGNGHDYIDGGAGNDILSFNGFTSAVQANLETNYYYSAGFGVHNYTVLNVEGLEGSSSADILTGDSNDNLFIASAGNDTIDGGAGLDTIDYSNRTSRVHIDFVRDIYDIDFNGSNDHSIINIENITGSEYADDLRGSILDNVINGQGGDDLIVGFAGNDILYGGAGHDDLYGQEDNDELYGQSGNDYIDGGDGDDFLSGVSGNDELHGGAGNDTLYGGADNDIIDGDDGDDLILASTGNDTVDGGAGIDTIDYSNSEAITTAIHIDITSGVYDIDFNGSNDHSVINVENIIGSQYADTIRGDALGNIIHGQNGDDILIGSLGDDTLYGEDGNDQLTGDEGADILYGGAGNDILKGRHDNDVLYGGDGDDILYGQNEDDEIYGGAGNDILDGGNGHDHIDGGDGQDTLSFASFFYAVEANLSTHYYYSTNFGVHNYTVINIEDLEGSDYSDILTGDDQDNVIRGLLGNDTIHAGVGADIIYGGLGVDTIYGGDGDDYIDGEDHDDVLRGGDGDDTIYGGVGHDDLYGDNGNDELYGQSGHDTLYGGDGDDFLSGVSGNDELYGGAGNDTLYGGADNDIIDGGDGDDELYGALGDDIIIGGDGYDLVDGGDGFDLLTYASLTSSLVINLKTGIASSSSFVDSISNIEQVFGGQAADTITGSDNADVIYGEAGDDILYGEAGNDHIEAGDGMDLVYGGDGDDELHGAQQNDVLFGNDGDDLIYGGGDDDTLYGGSGNDTLYGGLGNDGFYGGSGVDIFFSGQGSNIIDGGLDIDTVDYVLSSQALLISLLAGVADRGINGSYEDTITGIENVNGSDYDDQITGNNSDNILNGGNGNDTLYGLNGNDIFIGSSGNDVIDGGDGIDIINYSDLSNAITVDVKTNFIDTDEDGNANGSVVNVEHVIGTNYDDDIRGTNYDDVLEGGAGNDVLYGRVGNDVLEGGAGNDYLSGFKDNDVLDGGAGDDRLNSGDGFDILTGGYGADTFVFDMEAFNDVDVVTDFNLSDGDMIDLASILDSFYDPISDAISDFIRFTDSGLDSLLQVDQNGGADSFVTIAQLTGHNGLDADVLETNGHLITEYV